MTHDHARTDESEHILDGAFSVGYLWNMRHSFAKLEADVRKAVEPTVDGAKVRSVRIETDEEDDSLRIVIEISKAKDRLPRDVLLKIVNAASEAVAAAGEDRFAKVFGRFAATQDFAA